jgi:hypothetical protein
MTDMVFGLVTAAHRALTPLLRYATQRRKISERRTSIALPRDSGCLDHFMRQCGSLEAKNCTACSGKARNTNKEEREKG